MSKFSHLLTVRVEVAATPTYGQPDRKISANALSWNTRNSDLKTSTSINQNVASHCIYIDNPNLGMCITILQCQHQTLYNIDSITQRKVRGVNYSAGDWDTFAGQGFCLLANCPRCPMWPMCPAQCWGEFVFPTRMCTTFSVHTFLKRQQCLRPKNFNKDLKAHTF